MRIITVFVCAFSLSCVMRAQFTPGLTSELRLEGMLQSATRRQLRVLPSTSLTFVPAARRNTRTLVDFATLYDAVKTDTSPVNISRRHVGKVEQMFALGAGTKYFVAIDGELYHNNALGMRLQQSYGGGLVARLVERQRSSSVTQTFSLVGGMRYMDQQFLRQDRQRFAAFLVGQRFYQDVKVAKFTQAFFLVLPMAESRSSWQFRTVADLRFPVWRGLSFSVSGFDDYVRNAPPRFRRNFYTVNVGFAFNH